MKKIEHTAVQTAEDSPNDEREYFTYASIFGLMAESVKKHDPALYRKCASQIDMSETCTLRGLGYLGQLLAHDKNASDMQRSFAGGTIAEITALMAVLIEIKEEASFPAF